MIINELNAFDIAKNAAKFEQNFFEKKFKNFAISQKGQEHFKMMEFVINLNFLKLIYFLLSNLFL